MPYGTTSPDRFDEFRELHADGLGRNVIARRMGISNAVTSRTAEHLGLSFDRSKIQAAAEARKVDLEERRSLIAARFMDLAEDSLGRIYAETTVYSFGGKDNIYREHTFGEAPIAERVKLLTAAAIAVDKSLKLVPAEASSGLDAAKSMLGALGEALASYSRDQDQPETPADEGDGA